MPEINVIQAAACESGIGRETNPIKLLQLLAQTSADYALSADAGLDISVDAILARACTSGIATETDQTKLLQIIAQLLNDVQ